MSAEARHRLYDVTTTSHALINDATTFSYAGAIELLAVHNWYQRYHGYLATAVCTFGIVANTLNIVVLTRRNMISATNCLLTGLAVSDGLTMAMYLPFALRFYVIYGVEPNPERNSLAAARFMWFYACFSVVVHSVSIWLTVVLAVFRYIFIEYPRYSSTWCTVRRAQIAVVMVYVVTFFVCLPNVVTTSVRPQTYYLSTDQNAQTVTSHSGILTATNKPPEALDSGSAADLNSSIDVIWTVTINQDDDINRFISSLNFWIQAVVVKLIPCCGLTIISGLLVRALRVAEQRRQALRGREGRLDRRCKANSRTTRMLLLVVVLFLLTEFPQGVANLLNIVLVGFFDEIYVSLGDLLDILALINNGINFILYCAMSKQFRDTFFQLFVTGRCALVGRLAPLTTTTGAGLLTRGVGIGMATAMIENHVTSTNERKDRMLFPLRTYSPSFDASERVNLNNTGKKSGKPLSESPPQLPTLSQYQEQRQLRQRDQH